MENSRRVDILFKVVGTLRVPFFPSPNRNPLLFGGSLEHKDVGNRSSNQRYECY